MKQNLSGATKKVKQVINDVACQGHEPNLMNIASALRGWKPLKKGECMRISFSDGKFYTVTRTE